jgi:hypothetical protein
MDLGLAANIGTFSNLLDEIDPAAGAIALIAKNLIGRAGRSAKSAVHATPKNLLGGEALRRLGIARSKRRFHDNKIP